MAMQATDEKKPSLWSQAIKAVKGEGTHDLVEQFTSEMTLVAEGLCEDQARLRNAVDGLIREDEAHRTHTRQDIDALAARLDALEGDTARQMKDITRRLDAIDRTLARHRERRGLTDWMGRATLLAAIVCGTVLIVTVLKLFL